MTDIKNLYEIIKIKTDTIRDYNPEVISIPQYITDNLKYEFFEWQKTAFENLLCYEEEKSKLKKYPTHLMFNMATGTGKTLLMAASILFYYKKGYRHFLFFVNQNNIIDKTEKNFIDKNHNKYLFKDKIVIDDKTVNLKKVESFSDDLEDIEIKFTTIQKLYNDIHIERENQILLEDLNKKNIVMLADEAHHLNTNTKNIKEQQELDLKTEITTKTGVEEVERKGWEHTVLDLIWNKNGRDKNKNVLLEFTATIPENEQVAKKYSDKILFKFGLKEFLSKGYTKEINLISSTLNKKERILQALIFNWYRHKVAINHGIANFKPVILFRSKTIEESKSDFQYFLSIVENLQPKDLNFLDDIETKFNQTGSVYEQGKTRVRDVIEFIKKNNVSYLQISEYIKDKFIEKNCIITNSESNKTKTEKTDEEQESLLNNLEDKSNTIRAIFTVNRLTEGWDVLNLFDIVRLYQGQNTGGSTKKTPEATIKEKQLIGRGVRYYPFEYKDKLNNKRKFDDDLKNELRVLEELYYYTYDEESRYISHLKEELRKDGYITDGKVVKSFDIKDDFKEKNFFKNIKIWYNQKESNPNRRKSTLTDVHEQFSFEYKVKDLELNEQEMVLNQDEDIERANLKEKGLHRITKCIRDFEKHIFYKAINIKSKANQSLFQFERLKEELEISTIDDLLRDEFMGGLKINIILSNSKDFDDIANIEKLDILLRFLEVFSKEMNSIINPNIGTEFIATDFASIFNKPKTKSVKVDGESDRIAKELEEEDWYVLNNFYGTSEEKELIDFIKKTIGNLEQSYKEVYLLRNEEVYKIYDFDSGRGFQPDFIMFLKDKTKKELYYQVFIEPKGSNLLDQDEWKNKFLSDIVDKYGDNNLIKLENKKYSIIGLPLFNSEENEDFEEAYNKLINN